MTAARLTRRSVLTLPLVPAVRAHPLRAQEATPGPTGGVTGDWLMTGVNPARTGATAGPGLTSAPVERWRIPVDLSQQPAPTGPLIAEGVVVLWMWSDQRLHAYDVSSGGERWQADVGMVGGEGGQIGGAIGDGVLYIAGTFGAASSADSAAPSALFSLDLATGQERWRVTFTEELYVTSLLLTGSLVVFASDGPAGLQVTAIDTASGQQEWQTSFPELFSVSWWVAATAETLYLPATPREAPGGILIALEPATGAERWQAPTAGSARYGPVVAAGAVYLACYTEDAAQLTVEALDAETGTSQWQFVANDGTAANTLDIARIVAAQGTIYLDVSTQMTPPPEYALTNGIIALDGATGAEQWRVDGLATVVVAGDVLYVDTFDIMTDPNVQPATVALNAVTGNELWRLPGDARVLAASANLVIVESHEAVIAYGAP